MDYRARTPESRAALVSRNERFRMSGQFGSITGPQLSALFAELDRGMLERWSDFCSFVLSTDAQLISLHSTHCTRVAQADFQINPNEYGDQRMASLAAEFVDECIGRMDNWHDLIRGMAGAITPGVAAHEMRWADDRAARTKYVDHCTFVPAHRFAYDEQWKLRIYDRGQQRSQSSMYGALLRPELWIVHHHEEQSGYPSLAGVFRSCAWEWWFRREAERDWAIYLSKFGSPYSWIEVPEDATDEVRAQALYMQEQWAAGHSMVLEKGTVLNVNTSGVATGAAEVHEKKMLAHERSMTKAYLGTSDAVDAGDSGSRAAVETRTGATMDPRMKSAGIAIAGTLQRSYFKWLLQFNTHKFGNVMPPIPQMALKTATDEVKVDQQDLQDQARADGGRVPEIRTEPAAMSAQADDDRMTDEDARIIRLVRSVLHLSASEAGHDGADPKAQSRQQRPTRTPRTTRTSPTTSLSQRTLAKALRGK